MADGFNQTVVLDFDGVLHSYISRWVDAVTIPDPPVDGAREFCWELVKHFAVIVVSTRCGYPGGANAIANWLFVCDFPNEIKVSPDGVKPPSILTIDDRAWCFKGAFPSIDEIKSFKPWNKL